MKILIDINHPAHVHYFKNMIKIMTEKGHNFRIILRNKEIEHYLLRKYNIDFISRGIGKKTTFGKAFYFLYATFFLIKYLFRFKPDLVISFGTPYPAIASWLLGKSHVSINDTEHAKMHHDLTDPFSKVILTPSCYNKDLGVKQIRFNSYMELAYLHPNYFKPDPSVLKILNVEKNDKYVILRFVSWNAAHDVGQFGLSLEMKKKIVSELSTKIKVFISSEGTLPQDFKKYQIKIPPEKIHNVLAYATLFIGEEATMASECAMLGTPAIYINSLEVGSCTEEEYKYNLIYNYRNFDGVIKKSTELLGEPNIQTNWQKKKIKMLNDKIDVTAFFVWFFENYPKSISILKENPDYQYKFK
jgi:predicted glycosyltransferase